MNILKKQKNIDYYLCKFTNNYRKWMLCRVIYDLINKYLFVLCDWNFSVKYEIGREFFVKVLYNLWLYSTHDGIESLRG